MIIYYYYYYHYIYSLLLAYYDSAHIIHPQLKPLRKYQSGPKGRKKYSPGGGADAGPRGYYEEDDNDKLYDNLRDLLDWCAGAPVSSQHIS